MVYMPFSWIVLQLHTYPMITNISHTYHTHTYHIHTVSANTLVESPHIMCITETDTPGRVC